MTWRDHKERGWRIEVEWARNWGQDDENAGGEGQNHKSITQSHSSTIKHSSIQPVRSTAPIVKTAVNPIVFHPSTLPKLLVHEIECNKS